MHRAELITRQWPFHTPSPGYHGMLPSRNVYWWIFLKLSPFHLVSHTYVLGKRRWLDYLCLAQCLHWSHWHWDTDTGTPQPSSFSSSVCQPGRMAWECHTGPVRWRQTKGCVRNAGELHRIMGNIIYSLNAENLPFLPPRQQTNPCPVMTKSLPFYYFSIGFRCSVSVPYRLSWWLRSPVTLGTLI